MTIELLENSIESIYKGKEVEVMHEQFVPPYKYYNNKFDFYSANSMYMDEDGKWVQTKKDDKTKLAKNELGLRLRSEVSGLISFWEETIFPVWIQAIKDYQMCTLDRALMLRAQEKDFLTNEKQPIIRTYTDRVVSTVFRGGFSFNVYPQNETKVKKSSKAKHFAEWCFSTAKMRKTLLDVAVDGVLLGNGYYKIGFSPSREKIKEDVSEKDTVYNISDVYASSEYVSPFNVFYEPQRDFYRQPVIYRNRFSLRQILADKKDFFRLSKDQIAIILGQPQPMSDKNFNKIKLIKYYQQYILNNNIGVVEKDLYKVKVNDDLVEYVERWDGKNLVIAINGYIVYDYKSPTHTERHPFKRVGYTRTPGIDIGDGVGTILAGSQKLYDAMFNIMFDLAKFAAGPMFLLKPGQAIEGMGKSLNYEPFTFRQLRGAADATIETFQLPGPKDVNFQMMNDILNMANNAIAPTTYNELQGVSRSATDAEYRNESLRDAILPLIESMNEAFSESLKDYFIMAKHNMPNKFKIGVLGADGKQLFDSISLTDLRGNFTFEIEFESLKDINKTVERSQWNNLLAQLPAIANDPVRQKYLLNMESIATHVMSLYNPNNDNFILTDEQFYTMSEDGQKKMMEMQKKLEEFQVSLQTPPASVEPGIGEQYQTPPAEEAGQIGSPIATQSNAPLNVASILKEARE